MCRCWYETWPVSSVPGWFSPVQKFRVTRPVLESDIVTYRLTIRPTICIKL